MSMLAEPRAKKRKYNAHSAKINANWAQETNSIGLKLIQKMGWSEGKGLGVNESGKAEPLHIAFKADNRGLGCLGLEGDIAVAQQRGFEELLANLSQENGTSDDVAKFSEERETKSLESMSEKSRARVHYHKFTRGKDLSRASSKDLACILGVPDPDSSQRKLNDDLAEVAVGPQIEYHNFQRLESRGSSVDYFNNLAKKKKAQVDRRDKVNNEEDNSSEDAALVGKENDPGNNSILDSSSKERRKSVTWGDVEVSFVSKYIKDMADTSTESVNDTSLDELQGNEAEEVRLENGYEKKSKKKKKRKDTDEPLDDTTPSNVDSVPEIVDQCPEVPQNKKKKKKKVQETEINDIFDCSSSLDNSTPTVKKKKSKDKSRKLGSLSISETTVDNANGDLGTEIGDECSEVRQNKKKKKKEMQETEINDILDCSSPPIAKKKKSKGKSGKLDESPSNLETSVDKATCDLVTEIVDGFSEDHQNKKKKKKERLEILDKSLDCSSSLEYSVVEENTPKVKKKKSKDVSGKSNESLSTLQTSVVKDNDNFVTEVSGKCLEVQKKQKKKKKDIQEAENNLDCSVDCISFVNSAAFEATSKGTNKKPEDISERLVDSPSTKKNSEDKEVKAASASSNIKTLKFKKLKRKLAHSSDNSRENIEIVNLEERKQNKSKRKQSPVEDQFIEIVEVVNLEDERANKKKRKQSPEEDQATNFAPLEKKRKGPDVELSNSSTAESNGTHALSALTLERMEKWKQRKQSKKGNSVLENKTEPVETKKNTKQRKKEGKKDEEEKIVIKLMPSLDFTSDKSIVNYNHRKLYAALGYSVKDATDKVATIVMPPTKIPGSNLDSILGYGVQCS
ncbi:uncharacterized protein LOC117644634 [Thrips palmi]|uniref:Uncharacterized protein LOC117644634 n=1 Tax=Thrips palmi TaxID=161013 RepID=A0A6P8ZM80_THRPL|nr:uncharacterized protein LOC117644634 [Thrips palmi]